MGKKILFQGDSITDCGRTSSGGAGFNGQGLGPGYPGMVASRLWCDHPDAGYEVINRGISGNRIVDLYARWKMDALNLNPDVISILIGVNDTWHERNWQNGVEVPRYERIFRELLAWTKEALPNVKLVLIEPFIGDNEGIADMAPEVAERAAVVRKLAAEFDAEFLPMQQILNDNAKRSGGLGYWFTDGVHPSPAGQQLIADEWLKLMAPYL